MAQQQLPKVIKEHLPADSDLHEPTLISPKCASVFYFFLIKIPESGRLN